MHDEVCPGETQCVSQILEEEGCRSVVDFGCGEASWVRSALLNPRLEDLSEVLGVDTATSSLNRARRFIGIEMFSRMAQPDLFTERMPRIRLHRARRRHLHAALFEVPAFVSKLSTPRAHVWP